MKRAQIAGLILLIISLIIVILCVWFGGILNWNWNSLAMFGVLIWLIFGIILMIIGLISLVVSTLSKKS